MSKITDLLAIPIGFLAIKALQGKVEDEETTPEVLPTGYTVAREEHKIKPFQIGTICLAGLPCGSTGTGPTPTGEPTGLGFGVDAPDFEAVEGLIEQFGKVGEHLEQLSKFQLNLPKDYKPFDPNLFPDLSKLAELQKKQSMEQ